MVSRFETIESMMLLHLERGVMITIIIITVMIFNEVSC